MCTACGARGLVYLIQQDVTWAVKIGFTSDGDSLVGRVATLQTASPYRLRIIYRMPGSAATEAQLHRRFQRYRLMGEWFSPSIEMAEWLAEHKASAPMRATLRAVVGSTA